MAMLAKCEGVLRGTTRVGGAYRIVCAWASMRAARLRRGLLEPRKQLQKEFAPI
jgi:hypothetical protein